MKNNKKSKLFVAFNGITIRVSSLLACLPIKSNPSYYKLYFDTGLILVVDKQTAKDLTSAFD